MKQVGVRALQQNTSAVLRRVAAGERIEVIDRGRVVALLVPVLEGDISDRLAAQGRLVRATRSLLKLGRPLRRLHRGVPASERLARSRVDER